MSLEQRRELTHAVLAVMSRWGLDREHQLILLGLPADTRPRVLRRFQNGEPLPPDPKIMERVACLLQVEQALQPLFPHNPILADLWVTTPSPHFSNCAPIAALLDEGLPAMRALVAYLNGGGADW